MYCTKCGTENIESAKFCQQCGAKLEYNTQQPKNGLLTSVKGRMSTLELYDYMIRIKTKRKNYDYLLEDLISVEIKPPHGMLQRFYRFKLHIRGLNTNPSGGIVSLGSGGVNLGAYGGGRKPVTYIFFNDEQLPKFQRFQINIERKLKEIHGI
ncbi:MAG: zinc-ribbon domain-containing protein [Methanobacterium sp.]